MRTLPKYKYNTAKRMLRTNSRKDTARATGLRPSVVGRIAESENYDEYLELAYAHYQHLQQLKADRIYKKKMQYEPVGESPNRSVWKSITALFR